MFFTLEVKMEEEKRKRLFWTLILRSFFLKTQEEAKKQSNEFRDPSQQIFTRDARAIFQREYSRGRRICKATSSN